MKISVLATSFLFLIIAATCNNRNISDSLKLTGIVETSGMTTYQYGSHTLTTDEETYALTSGKIDLSKLEGQTVTIIAEKIEGYPTDGGPQYLKVIDVEDPQF